MASAILIVDAEISVSAPDEINLWRKPYTGYLPASGPQRRWLLCLLMCFTGPYLAMSASSIAAASSWAMWVVLAMFCVHVVQTAASGTFVARFVSPNGQASLSSVTASFVSRAAMFMIWLMCPAPASRHPLFIGGPQYAAGIVTGSFGLALTVILTTLGWDMQAWSCAIDSNGCSPAELLVIRVCVPSFVLALAALIGFIRAVNPQYRWSFYWPDTLSKDHQRCWQAQPDDADGDARRAKRVRYFVDHMADVVAAWLDRRKGTWTETQPEWLTEEWWAKVPKVCRGTLSATDLGLKKAATLGEFEC